MNSPLTTVRANTRFEADSASNQDRSPQLVSALLGAISLVAVAVCIILSFVMPSWPVTYWANLVVLLVSAILFYAVRKGYARIVGIIALIVISSSVAIDSLNPNRTFGLTAPAIPLLIVFAAYVYGRRLMLGTILLNIAWVTAVTLIKLTVLPVSNALRNMQVIDASAYVLYFIATGLVMLAADHFMSRAQQRVDATAKTLALRNQALEHEVALRKQLEHDQTVRATELSKLLDLTTSLSSTLELPTLLKLILSKLEAVVPFDEALIAEFVLPKNFDARVISIAGAFPETLKGQLLRYSPVSDFAITHLLNTLSPIVFMDVKSNDSQTTSLRNWMMRDNRFCSDTVSSAMLVPLVVKGRCIGLMCLCTANPTIYSARLAELALAFASQSAAALDSVRMHGEALQAAALNERTRLARDLHDSVSQSLYGIVLGARTAIAGVDNGSATGQALEYVLKLAETGLTEMRALIFELRPEHLQQDGLIGALRRQVQAICMRHQIGLLIDLNLAEPDLPTRAKEGIYRIVLEAVQNSIKHSGATELVLLAQVLNGTLTVKINDNGCGFTPRGTYANSWGIVGMHERAHDLDGALSIDSTTGFGTRVTLTLPYHSQPEQLLALA